MICRLRVANSTQGYLLIEAQLAACAVACKRVAWRDANSTQGYLLREAQLEFL
jgi:hypothetical protein